MTRWYDLVVIGMGVGGEEVAGRAAEAGMDALGIERKPVGGECHYALLGLHPLQDHGAGRQRPRGGPPRRHGGRHGERDPGTGRQLPRRIRQATAGWPDEVAVRRFEKQAGTFRHGTTRITGPREVEVGGQPV